jgi:hypothetical protein
MTHLGRARRALRCGALLASLAALAAAPARAQAAAGSLEYPVKASLLLRFAKFAEWPAGSAQAGAATVSICLLGPDPFGSVIDAIVRGQTVGGRKVEVRRYKDVDGIEACHVLFVPASATERVAPALARVRELPVLTVGENGDFDARGGVIRLLVEDNHARFSVNLATTELSHLRLSSKLLGVARSVRVGALP